MIGRCFIFYWVGREAGKSYATSDFFIRQFKKYGRPFYWLRLTSTSAQKLLTNKAEKLVDSDLRRKYKLDLTVRGDGVYQVLTRHPKTNSPQKVKLMARVLALDTFYNDKGSGLFDKDFLADPNMYYNICLDEMNREKNERKTFDIVYAFANQLENLVRSTKNRLRIICIGNTLEEASDILSAFNFLPQTFGRYKLHSKRAVIEYIKPSEKYLKRRSGTVADILAGDSSTFTNMIDSDTSLITKQRLIKPTAIIKFTNNQQDWFTVWDSKIVNKYNYERITNIIGMRPYIKRTVFNSELQQSIIGIFDARAFNFHNLITMKLFQKNMELLKPRTNG